VPALLFTFHQSGLGFCSVHFQVAVLLVSSPIALTPKRVVQINSVRTTTIQDKTRLLLVLRIKISLIMV
jgi:hypothetical protein